MAAFDKRHVVMFRNHWKMICVTVSAITILSVVVIRTNFPTTIRQRVPDVQVKWDFVGTHDISIVQWPDEEFRNHFGMPSLGIYRLERPLHRSVAIKLSAGILIDEFWDTAIFLEHKGVLGDVLLYSPAESVVNVRLRAKRICSAFGKSSNTSWSPVDHDSIDAWCQAAEQEEMGQHVGYGISNEWFPIVVNDPVSPISASILLRWAPNVEDYTKPCTLLLDIAWPGGDKPNNVGRREFATTTKSRE